jgi:hypothetical protein
MWILQSIKPNCVLTEKISAKIYLSFVKDFGKNYYMTVNVKNYVITKFLLLQQIVQINLIHDLLKIIINLSD